MSVTPATESAFKVLARHLHTRDEVITIVQQLETCRQLLFTTRSSEKKVVAQLPHLVVHTMPVAVSANPRMLDEWLKQLVGDLQRLPVATVSVAYVPTLGQAQELIAMVHSGFDTPVVVDLCTDAKIMAGVRIECASTRIEYSLQVEIDELLAEKERVHAALQEKGSDV